MSKATSVAPQTETGWVGRISAALIGGTLLAFAVGVAITIYVPGFDGLDEAFLGGLTLVLIWPCIMLWVLFAHSGKGAWKRILLTLPFVLVLDIVGLMT